MLWNNKYLFKKGTDSHLIARGVKCHHWAVRASLRQLREVKVAPNVLWFSLLSSSSSFLRSPLASCLRPACRSLPAAYKEEVIWCDVCLAALNTQYRKQLYPLELSLAVGSSSFVFLSWLVKQNNPLMITSLESVLLRHLNRWTLALEPALTFEIQKKKPWWIKMPIMQIWPYPIFSSFVQQDAGRQMRMNNHRWLEQTLLSPEGIWKHWCVPLPCSIRQHPCIITIPHWHIQAILTQQYILVGNVAIMLTHC